MKRFLILLGLCVALILGPTSAGFAADESALQRIVESGEFKVGTSAAQPPFSMKARDGSLMGFEIDLARFLADAMGVEVKMVVKPFGELLAALESGEVDAVMSGMTMTPARNLRVAFVGPYFVSGKSILTKSRTLAAAAEASDIDASNASLVALEGSTSQVFVEKLMPRAKLQTTKDYEEAVQLVIDDKADALVADMPICVLSVLRNPNAGLATLAVPLTIEPIGIALPPGDTLLLNLVENYLGALQAVGVLDELEHDWFERGTWVAALP